jgi:hypothetical protein
MPTNATMPIDTPFHAAYRELQHRMKSLAESDGDIFLPNPEPEGPARSVLICMEPSLGRWARSAEDGKARVEAGFRNFLSSLGDFILHFATSHYLCKPGERYHITDLSKGAMVVKRAAKSQLERYDRWYPLLLEELQLVAAPDARIVAVGGAVAKHLTLRHFQRPFTRIMHYSGQAGPARNAAVLAQEDKFLQFSQSVSVEAVLATAEAVFKAARVPAGFRDETLTRLRRSQLTTSRKKLMFSYKLAFESMRSDGGS